MSPIITILISPYYHSLSSSHPHGLEESGQGWVLLEVLVAGIDHKCIDVLVPFIHPHQPRSLVWRCISSTSLMVGPAPVAQLQQTDPTIIKKMALQYHTMFECTLIIDMLLSTSLIPSTFTTFSLSLLALDPMVN